MAHAMAVGFLALMEPRTLLLLVVGMLAGTLIGVLPGLGGAVLLSMLLPFLYNMKVVPALALLLGAHASIYFSGSITSILVNTPGTAESAATTFDGYAMTRKGLAARALGISATATTLGGWLGVIALVALIPVMLNLVTLFHPPDYVMLAVLAVVLISSVRSGSVTKGLLSGGLGFMLAFIGYDPITGVRRFTFGLLGLYNGLNIVAVALGLFALGEMYYLYGLNRAMTQEVSLDLSHRPGATVMDGVRDVLGRMGLVIRSAVVGVVIGIIPGIGGVAANFISYGQAMQTSKHPERFGTGVPEGVIAPEASSLSKEAGSLIPTVSLGIPGSTGMAILLSGFLILGISPGPTMLTKHLPEVFSMAWILAITSLLASVLGLALAPWLAQITRVPGPAIVPFILVLSALGVYAATGNPLQVAAMVGIGVVGLVMKRYDYSLAGAIVGFLLGGIVERNLWLTEQIYGWRFIERPLTDLLILVTIAVLVVPLIRRRRAARGTRAADRMGEGTAP